MKNQTFKIIAVSSRMLVGLVFIFSGFVKGIDPLGLTYKMQEYFVVYHMEWMSPLALTLAIFFCILEFATGVALLFNLRIKIFSWIAFLLMVFFTIQTYVSAVKNLVTDCGCFGDAIHLTNWQTFYKNIVIIIPTILIFIYRKKYKSMLTLKGQTVFSGASVLFMICISLYCYMHLPLIDFLPWKVGTVISEKLIPTPEVAEMTMVYKNVKSGEVKKYSSAEFAKLGNWDDSIWANKWQKEWSFVNTEKKILKPFVEAPIHDFKINDQDGNDHTEQTIKNPNFNFILVAHNLDKSNKNAFIELNNFVKQCQADNINFIALTSTPFNKIDIFRHDVQAMYDFYNTDETALKTMIRSNPGLILLKNGVVIAKWHYNDIPDFKKVKEKYLK